MENNNLITNNTKMLSELDVLYDIGYPVSISFIELQNEYLNSVPWQWHTEIEIIIINHGEVAIITSDKRQLLKAGEGIIINSNVMHSIEPATKDANCSLYSMTFHPSFLFGYGNIQISDKYLTPVVNSKSFSFIFLSEEDENTAPFLDYTNTIIAENLIKKMGYELSTKALLCQIWILLLERIMPKTKDKKPQKKSLNLDESRSKDIITYIENNYAEKITLEELAESVHISKSECCRCFKRALDTTPVEYLMKYRISVAASLILSDDPISHSISQLSRAVGFNNASYFNKVFKDCIGCTPSEYKKKMKDNDDNNPFA